MSEHYDIWHGSPWGNYLFFMLTDHDDPEWYICPIPLDHKETQTPKEERWDYLNEVLNDAWDPPHRGDNVGHRSVHGPRQRLYKMRRKGRA